MYKALIISVDQYLNVSNLPNTMNDAREIKRLLLESPSLFESKNVLEFHGTISNRTILLTALDSFFKDAEKEDVLFLYWAGHGAFINNEAYFVPFDGDIRDSENSLIKMSSVRELIDETRANTVLSFFDTCHSGAIARKIQEEMIRGLEVHGAGKVLIAACTQEQGAWDRDGHGAFTDYLIQGLEGKAANQYGDIDIYNLYSYVSGRLQEEFSDQNPIIKSTLLGAPILLKRVIERSAKSTVFETVLEKIVSSSGSSFLLGSVIAEYEKCQEQGDGTFHLLLENPDTKIEHTLKQMNQPAYPFALRNEAHVVVIENIDTNSSRSGTKITIKLRKKNKNSNSMFSNMTINENGKTLSGDEIAKIRAHRILFGGENEFSTSYFSMLENSIMNPTNAYLKVVPNLTLRLIKEGFSNEEVRVALISSLVLTDTVEVIETLNLEIENEQIKGIHLVGYRPKYYTNVDPVKMEVHGTVDASMASEK